MDVRVAVSVAGLHLDGAVRGDEPIVGMFVDKGRAEARHRHLAENDLCTAQNKTTIGERIS